MDRIGQARSQRSAWSDAMQRPDSRVPDAGVRGPHASPTRSGDAIGPPKPTTLATILPTPATGGSSSAVDGPAASGGTDSFHPQPRDDECPGPDDRDSEVDRVAAALSSLQDASWQDGSDHGDSNTADCGSNTVHNGNTANTNDDSDSDGTSAAPADVRRHLVEMLSQEDIADRVMQRGVRIVYVGQEYSNIHYLIRQRARHAPPSVHHFPSNQISRRYTSHQLDRIPRKAFALPPAAVVDELLAAYFRHVHPGFPVLDEAVFMSQYRRRDPRNPPSLLVLQAVLMVGAHVCSHRPDRAALKTSFFRRAKMLFDARFEWNRDVVVQAALLMTWHSEGVEDIGANSYYWVGVAARTALGLGMHRDAGASTLVAPDQRLWRRLWWILVQFDVIVSLSYGRPPAVRLDESDVPELRPDDFDSPGHATGDDDNNVHNGHSNTNTNTQPPLSPIHADFTIHQTRLCCIIAHTLRDRFGLRVPPERRRAALADADQRLAHWMATLPSSLRHHLLGCSGSVHPAASAPPWVAMLHMTYNNFLILLHRPPPPQPTATIASSVTSQDDMGICSSAATALVHLLEGVAARDELRFLNVFAVDAVFTALIQLSAEIRVTNPVLAAHAMRRFDSAMDIMRRLAAFWLNAEIILRLFEDSSERLRAQLVIGKSSVSTGSIDSAISPAVDQPHHTREQQQPLSPSQAIDPATVAMASHAHGFGMPGPQHVDVLQALMLSPATTLQQHMASVNEQLDWTNLYWENSGFTSLSPFAEMRMYPPS
ncbi:acetamidase regulatory protein [Grosmannia clavigera kw1407]|uniref:Acetamidase regulatory protein n=1 Tax=Grosmannia clavigera (strain kw1407 / UAMH 11150) TaxID=655863 RepID=F0XUJ7_GROCL|nr:acetamidase regulatory protein [Grosmannia clavigera kw1407]EFW98919.1 acetamidase regulatory protein [Grosmannia clavigera kw1407]